MIGATELAVAGVRPARERFAGQAWPLVSIVTPSFNQGRYIERTVRSVLAQDYPRIEYIVVDGLSVDQTPDILRRYSRKISRTIRERDSGQSNAINKGFAVASGQILAWLNSDDCYASPRVVSTAVDYLKTDEEVDLVYGRRKYTDENGYLWQWQPFQQFSQDLLMAADYIPQECCFWTREIFESSGPYIDESFDFAMDYELWLRFLKNGARFAAIPEFFGLFRNHDSQKTRSQWQNKGLPEIERLHKTYLDRDGVDEYGMYNAFNDHFAGFDRRRHPRSEKLRQWIWQCLVARAETAKGIAPLDGWVFERTCQV